MLWTIEVDRTYRSVKFTRFPMDTGIDPDMLLFHKLLVGMNSSIIEWSKLISLTFVVDLQDSQLIQVLNRIVGFRIDTFMKLIYQTPWTIKVDRTYSSVKFTRSPIETGIDPDILLFHKELVGLNSSKFGPI